MANDKKISKPKEVNLEEIENAIGGETEKEEAKETKKIFGKAETEEKKDIFVKEEDTFAKKAAEAAANAALKAAIDANSETSMKEAEKAYFIEKKNHMLKRCKSDKKATRTISKFYAPYLGKIYTFLYNGIPVTIYCDGKPHEYPEFIAKKIDKKLLKIADSNTYKEIIDERLDQDTF